MNIAFAKVGKSIKFKSAYSPIGGDNEAPAIFKNLVNNNPDKTFYLVGRSDYSKLNEAEVIEMFPYGNVVDCYSDPNMPPTMHNPDVIVDFMKRHEVEIDFGIMMVGQVGTVTIPGKIEQVRDRSLIASVIDMTKNYSTPIIYWLNDSKVPYIEIINDPRYDMSQARDILNVPKKSLSQFDYTYTHNKIKSYEDQDREIVEVSPTYQSMETGFCLGREVPDLINLSKSKRTLFSIILNEGTPSRFSELKKWVLDYSEDINIYGKWDHSESLKLNCFKGSVPLEKTQEIMRDTKYTFIIPIAKGWVTAKYIEMIHTGCIPFFHPDYDTQGHIDVPEFLRIKSPIELFEKINLLETDKNMYENILKELQNKVLKKEYYDGSFMNDKIMTEGLSIINKEYVKPNLNDFEKQELFDIFDF